MDNSDTTGRVCVYHSVAGWSVHRRLLQQLGRQRRRHRPVDDAHVPLPRRQASRHRRVAAQRRRGHLSGRHVVGRDVSGRWIVGRVECSAGRGAECGAERRRVHVSL